MHDWDGVSVPPTGTHCEYRYGSRSEWTRAMVLFKSEQYIVFRLDPMQPYWEEDDTPTKEAAPIIHGLQFRPVTPTMYLVSELFVDPMENSLDKAMGYEPVGYVTDPAYAQYLKNISPTPAQAAAWPLQLLSRNGEPTMRYRIEQLSKMEPDQ